MIYRPIVAMLIALFFSFPASAQTTCPDGFELNPDENICVEVSEPIDDGTQPQLLRFLTPDDQDAFDAGTSVAPTGRSSLSFAQDLPLDLTIILDRSASMLAFTPILNDDTPEPNDVFRRFELVDKAVSGLLSILPDNAEVTLIDFASDVRALTTKLGLGVVEETDRQGIVDRLSAIVPTGETNFRGALDANRLIADTGAASGLYLPDDYDREILVLSDGKPTQPVSISQLFFLGAFGDVTAVTLPGTDPEGFSFLRDLANFSSGQLLDYRFDAQGFLDSFLGDNLLLTGLAGVEITDPNGSTYAAQLDALGQFTLDPFALNPGDNIFTARASFLDGTEAMDTLTLIGNATDTDTGGGSDIDTIPPVPLPAAGWMLLLALAGGTAVARKKR